MDAIVKVEPIAAVAGFTTCTLTGEQSIEKKKSKEHKYKRNSGTSRS